MIVIKQFIVKLDLKSIDDIYVPKEIIVTDLLKNTYEKKCFRGCFILEILDISNISIVKISSRYDDARGLTNVIFNARVLIYGDGEIIYKCVVDKKIKNRIFAKTEHSVIILMETHGASLLKMLKPGDIIPVYIIKSKHAVLEKRIAVYGYPLLPTSLISKDDVSNVYSLIAKKYSDSDIKKLTSYAKTLNDLLKWASKLDKRTMVKFKKFTELFYPYKKIKNPPVFKLNKKHIKLMDVQDAVNDNNIRLIFCPSEISLASAKIGISTFDISDMKLTEENNIIEEDKYVVLEMILLKKIMFLTFIRDIVTDSEYSSKENSYWKILESYKR